MSAARRTPWWVLIVALLCCAVLLFGPLWGSYLGENPLERAPAPDYGTIVRLAVPTVVLTMVLAATMLWAGRGATPGAGSVGEHD